MKKGIIIAVIILLLLSAGVAFVLFYPFDNGDGDVIPVDNTVDLYELAKSNASTAFSFLTDEKYELPDNMKGYILDLENDMDLSDTSEKALKAAVESTFEKVDAITPNTILARFTDEKNYDYNGFDIMNYLIEKAHENDISVFLYFDELNVSAAEKYGADGILIDYDGTGDIPSVNDIDIPFGIAVSEKMNDKIKKSIENSEADFYFVKINSSSETGAEAIVQSWAQSALKSKSKVYAILRNDLVMSGKGWTHTNEINIQLRMLYNHGGFAGCVMSDYKKLRNDDNYTATNLYSYYEYFNDSDYTALTVTDFALNNTNTAAVFTGTSDKDYPVHIFSTASDAWQSVATQGENGSFTAEIPLREGENKVVLKHKNAMYTYYIDRAVDVMTSCSASVDSNTVNLTATAVKGARVWASLANTVLVELTADNSSSEKYATYSASFELDGEMAALQNDQVSFAAEYNGLTNIEMCGETKKPSPYEDNGLGTSLMCVVTSNYAETTAATAPDNNSDPTCTPQLEGSVGYVDSFSVIENYVSYSLTSGVRIFAYGARLIVGGYIMPGNNISLTNVSTSSQTELTFTTSYPVFTKVMLSPQEYYIGYLQRPFNLEKFAAEYFDITFMDTALCSSIENIYFSGSTVISGAEWYSNSENNTVTLRLYLREAGKFSGYSLYRKDGDIILSFKNDPQSLEGTVIMLDPGHGGYGSPGTNSGMEVYEKDLTLLIAKKTADILRENGATVILTRDSDEAVFLNERAKMIRSANPDIFVSIHCDGADNTSWLGTQTFYYKSYSMPLAASIHKQIVNAYRSSYYTDPASDDYDTVDMGYKFFPYLVTRVEECPSVLVECGYLTNEKDAAFMKSDYGQSVIAAAIVQGIADYIINN